MELLGKTLAVYAKNQKLVVRDFNTKAILFKGKVKDVQSDIAERQLVGSIHSDSVLTVDSLKGPDQIETVRDYFENMCPVNTVVYEIVKNDFSNGILSYGLASDVPEKILNARFEGSITYSDKFQKIYAEV